MWEGLAFHQLLQRVRVGDPSAAAELVRAYEPVIRRAVRFRLGRGKLRPFLDSLDICQSVLVSFFVRAAAGQYDLAGPEDLVRLLVSMALNKVAGHARKELAERRDRERTVSSGRRAFLVADPAPPPDAQAADRELLATVYRHLTPAELRLIELRQEGLDWATIAARLGGNAASLRKQMSRALDRVEREMGLGEGGDD
jgi:RNA polymerase sigma factor (sigma-70 family)